MVDFLKSLSSKSKHVQIDSVPRFEPPAPKGVSTASTLEPKGGKPEKMTRQKLEMALSDALDSVYNPKEFGEDLKSLKSKLHEGAKIIWEKRKKLPSNMVEALKNPKDKMSAILFTKKLGEIPEKIKKCETEQDTSGVEKLNQTVTSELEQGSKQFSPKPVTPQEKTWRQWFTGIFSTIFDSIKGFFSWLFGYKKA